MTIQLSRTAEALALASAIKQDFVDQQLGADAAPVLAHATAHASAIPSLSQQMESGIRGIGFGYKIALSETIEETLALRVYVEKKMPRAELSTKQMVPSTINGYPTDVIEVGDLRSYAVSRCGVSGGHLRITTGTLGCLAQKRRGAAGRFFFLSNNHVLANSNAAKQGDPILAPGPLDRGRVPDHVVGRLSEWVDLSFSSRQANRVDAAIAEVLDPTAWSPEIEVIGRISARLKPAAIYQSVRKTGRTTGHTIGVVTDIAADVSVRYDRKVAYFEDQLAIIGIGNTDFSDGGDSGSLIVDAVQRRPVGLLFAGGGQVTFANPIEQVCDALDIRIVS